MADPQDVAGLWHEAHEVPKWFDGALWHDRQFVDPL